MIISSAFKFFKQSVPFHFAVALPIFFVASLANVALGEGGREAYYSISSKGFDVGEMKTVTSTLLTPSGKALKFESILKIDANFVVYSYSLDSKEEAHVNDEGTFYYRRIDRKKNQETVLVEGKLNNGRLHFEVKDQKGKRSLDFSRKDYDATTMDCPEAAMKAPGDKMTLRILDVEHLEIVSRSYTYVRNEELSADGVKSMYKVIDFEDPNKRSRRWVRPDPLGIIVGRQDGRGSGGAYSLRLKRIAVKM